MGEEHKGQIYQQIRRTHFLTLMITLFVVVGVPGHIERYKRRNTYHDFEKEREIIVAAQDFIQQARRDDRLMGRDNGR